QLIARVRDAFQVDLPLRRLFEAPTVAALAEQIEIARRAAAGLQASLITSIARDRALPLSFAQERLWVLDQLVPDNPAYNISAALRLAGLLDVGALARGLDLIVRRHEALRTSFMVEQDQPAQLIAAPTQNPQ